MALYELREILTDKILNLFEWDGIEPFDSGSDNYVVLNTDPYVWTGLYPPTQNYIDIYGGEFYGVFHGIHIGNTDGTASYSTSASFAESSSYVFSGSLDHIDHLGFDTGSLTTPTEGTFVWNEGDGTLDLGLKGGNVILQLGQEQLARVYNAETSSLVDGEIVYIYGAQGNRISVKRADNSTEATSKNTIGVVTETILAGEEGFVTTGGVVHGLNIPSSSYSEGDTLFLGNNGQYTKIKPTAPNHIVIIGFVERTHQSQGSIFVKIDNGYELDELHNVNATQPTTGDLLLYSGSVWTGSKVLIGNYEISGGLLLTGSIDVSGSLTGSFTGSFTGSLQGTSSYATTASFTSNIKSGVAITGAAQQTGSGQYIYNISFDTSYPNNNYSVVITATSDLRIWTVENRISSGFRINSNSTVATTGDVYWITIPYNN